MRICVIFNPAARGERARRFQRHLEELGRQCTLQATWAPGSGRRLAAEAVREGFETIVAAGGDGTMNEVLNGIGDEPEGFARARLGVLPLGTVNVFAKEYNLPSGILQAWEIIQGGKERLLDLAVAELGSGTGRQRRYFAQMAGAGFDARAVELVDWNLKKKIGYFAYVVAVLKTFRGPRSYIKVTHDQQPASGELVLIGNGRFYAGRFTVFPLADASDGRLDVCVFSRTNWWATLRCAWGLLSRRLDRQPGVKYFQADSLALASVNSAPLQLDGEYVGQLPAVISVRPRTVRLIVP